MKSSINLTLDYPQDRLPRRNLKSWQDQILLQFYLAKADNKINWLKFSSLSNEAALTYFYLGQYNIAKSLLQTALIHMEGQVGGIGAILQTVINIIRLEVAGNKNSNVAEDLLEKCEQLETLGDVIRIFCPGVDLVNSRRDSSISLLDKEKIILNIHLENYKAKIGTQDCADCLTIMHKMSNASLEPSVAGLLEEAWINYYIAISEYERARAKCVSILPLARGSIWLLFSQRFVEIAHILLGESERVVPIINAQVKNVLQSLSVDQDSLTILRISNRLLQICLSQPVNDLTIALTKVSLEKAVAVDDEVAAIQMIRHGRLLGLGRNHNLLIDQIESHSSYKFSNGRNNTYIGNGLAEALLNHALEKDSNLLN